VRHHAQAGGSGHHHEKKGFFGWFNRTFATASTGYQGIVARILKRSGRYLIIYAVIIAGVVLLFQRLPSSFLPDEDQGYMITVVQLPTGATQERTIGVLKQIEDYYLQKESKVVDQMITVAGFSFFGRGQNGGGVRALKDWKERGADHRAGAGGPCVWRTVVHQGRDHLPAEPAGHPELGNRRASTSLQDRAGQGHAKLMEARNRCWAWRRRAGAAGRASGRPGRRAAAAHRHRPREGPRAGSVATINTTLSTALGSSYVNDFIDEGRCVSA
jgi:multidrug efflux pump